MRVSKFTLTVLLACIWLGAQADFLPVRDSVSGSSKDHLTQILNGIATNIKDGVDVASLISCGDDFSFSAIEAALYPIMDEFALCAPSNYDDIGRKIIALVKSIPTAQQQCVIQNPESQKLLKGLGLLGLTPAEIKSKITYGYYYRLWSACGLIGGVAQSLKSSDFQGFGTSLGNLAVDIFKPSSQKQLDA